MTKNSKILLIACAAVCLCALGGICFLDAVALADGEYTRILSVSGITATVGGTTVSGIYSDPASCYEEASSGYLNNYSISVGHVDEKDSVIYTALFPYTTTQRTGNVTEYVCEAVGSEFVVSEINSDGDGSTYIPVGGFVLSLNSDVYADFATVGDKVVLGGSAIELPTKAVESSSGKRIVVDNTNTTRSGPMVVYYDYQFGEKTGTNVYGTEMTCVYDFDKNTFVVTSFRNFGEGDASGSDIPDNSFVLSAYGEGYRQLLVKNQLFSLGDEVKMVGFDFIRFGGTVVGSFDFINPTAETNPAGMETETSAFPAYRGTNQTIIYKYGWSYNGSAGTGTNVYGYEAAVDEDGVVVELNVNVSSIPENGYVISGHGTGRDFIRSNIVLGATVVLDETTKTYSVSTTLNSYYENLVTEVNSAVSAAETVMRSLYDVDYEALGDYIGQVNASLGELKTVKEQIELALEGDISDEERLTLLMSYNDSQLKIEKLRRQIISASAESKTVSARAVWHRPYETTFAELEQNIQTYSEIGINMVLVETLYTGVSAFKSSVEEFPYNSKLADSYIDSDGTVYDDYLSAFVALCKEYNIEVHAWVENFYVGTLSTAKVLQLHPEWVLYNDDGTDVQRNEGGDYIFLDPANTEVQDLLIAYYLDLFEKNPDVAGLNLDYIRYPVSDEAEDTGYTEAAMIGFYEKMGLTFSAAQLADRTKMTNKFKQLFDIQYQGTQAKVDENYAAWVEYRTEIITSFVRRIKTEVKDVCDIVLSTSVFASLSESKNSKKQDWQTWLSNGWIDIATPMAYYTDSSDVLVNVYNMILYAGNNCYYYSGLASSYSGLPAYRNTEQIKASYSAGANGYVIFCSDQIIGHEDVQTVLSSGVNRNTDAVLPHADAATVIKACFDVILDRCDRIYIPLSGGGMTAEQRDSLSALFDEIEAMSVETAEDLYNVYEKISSLASEKALKSYAKGYSRQRILEQLQELTDLLDIKISRQLINDGEWDPEVDKVRPSFGADDPTDPDDPTPTEPQNPSDVGWVIAVVLGVVAVVAAVVVAVFVKRRKNRKND